MSNVSAHLYEYRRKARPRPSSRAPFLFPDLCTPPPHPPQVVRDLAWALASPHILSDDVDAHGVRVYSDDDARRALAESRAWLSSLDDDPAHLLRWVASQRGSNKLGFYFGALIEYAARFCPAIAAEAVTVHRQVAHDLGAGRMVGQLKLVAKRPDRTARRRDDASEKSSRSSSKAAGDEDERDDFPDDFSRDDFSDDFAASEVLHWEFNVKYFVDGGSVDSPTRRATRDARREDVASSPASHAGVSLSCPSDPAEPSANEPPLRAPNDDADDAAFDAAGLARPPSGDSCYVGPFLHENLHVRVSEARRKLALAGHPRVDGWLARWAAGRLEGEETLDPNSVPIVPREADAGVDAEGENPRGFRRRRVSEQILRGYLFYPLRGDERGGGSWARTRPRGHASANHLRGWWVTDPDEIALVPESHEDDPSDPSFAFLGERRSVHGAPHAPSGCSDRMWAVLTRKCHWLGPCEAEHVPCDGLSSDGSSSDPPPRDGATTPWIVRGVPELGIRDVEVVPTRLVADAAREVLRASDRGVLIAELIGPFRRSTDGASVWRERSRGFVLPKRWDPWSTVLRRDPFRRRYERGKLTAEELEDETAPEGTFEVMYPDRLDVDELGDDVRVGPRRVFRGNISWKTERDPVRDRASLAERTDASDPLDGGFDPKRRGAAGAKRADLGARFAAAAAASAPANPAASLLEEVRAVVGEERGLPRPARPHLVRALGQLGGFRESTADGDGNGNDVAIANENLRGATPPSSSARSRRLERERTETRALVSAAVRGAATCLVTLGRPANASTPTDATYSADAIDPAPASSVRTWAYSDRRRVAHALLDAIGPAARRNGCVGLAHVASVRAVFAGCLLKKAAQTDSPAASFDVGSACPRVAVRFANILRVPPTAAIDPGAASALAEALVRAVANGREDGDEGVVEVGDDGVVEDGDDGVIEDGDDGVDDSEPETLNSECILVRRSAPLSRLVSRAGAVAELLSWSGESAAFPESSAEILAVACVEAGHASAAEALARDVPSLSRRLVEAHAELGNHRAARRVAAELEWDRTDDRSELLFDLESLRVADTFDPDAFANDAESTARVSARADGHTPTPLANILADANEGILVVNCASTLETARERARFATNDALFASRTCPSSSVPISSSSFVSFVGLDCEWRPGVAGAPVELVQLAFGANRAGSGRARAVILDCPALLGDAADASLAEATARFLAEVFSRAVIVGFGVAGDVERLFASYPERFRVPAVPVPGRTENIPTENQLHLPLRASGARDPSPFPDATCACAKDAAVSLGIPAAATASLSSLCRAVLDGRALDKTQQKSDWARRPLTREQIAYAAADALAPAMAFHALAKVAKKSQKEDGRSGKRTRDEGASEEGASDEGASSETTNARIEDGNDVSIGRENDDVKNERRKEDVETVASVVAFARAWTRRVNASRAIERSERSAPPPRTVDDVLAEIARVPGLALETWPRAEDARAEDVETRRDGDERRATLCKTLGVVVTGAGSNPGAPRFVVCALRAGDDARLDMDALADAVARRRDERLDERLDERRDERLDEDDDERLDRRVSSASRSVRKVRCRMATRDELAREFGFPPGSMGPFGLRPDPNARRATFVDEDVFEGDAKKKVAVGGGASDVKVVGDAETLFRACGAVIARVSRRA